MTQDVINWLLEDEGTGTRYLAMRDLTDAGEKEIAEAKDRVHREGPIRIILDAMAPEGYWDKPGAGYYPKYTGTVWSLLMLSQLGASVHSDDRIRTACDYLLANTLTEHGQFSINGSPSQTIDCLQGNMLTALMDMGYDDPMIGKAYEWMAMTTTGEGVAPMGDKNTPLRYYSGKTGPGFACGANNKLPCAWGAAKIMMAFSRLPIEKRTPLVQKAIDTGVDFLLGIDLATAEYPSGYADKPSGNWWKFGFPVFYVSDILQVCEAMTALGYGNDPRLTNARELVLGKQDNQGRWLLEYDYNGKTWIDSGPKKKPNRWVTLRALRFLKGTGS